MKFLFFKKQKNEKTVDEYAFNSDAMTYSERAKRAILELSGRLMREIIDNPAGGDGTDSVAYRAGVCAGLNRAAELIGKIQNNNK